MAPEGVSYSRHGTVHPTAQQLWQQNDAKKKNGPRNEKLAFAVICAIASPSMADVHDGLINYWNFDGNFDDTAGSIPGNTSTKADNGSQPGSAVSLANWTDVNPDAAALGERQRAGASEHGATEQRGRLARACARGRCGTMGR